ncbi:MAG: DUF3179 domain-containing protein [Actinomycetota bacterium]
MRDDMWAQAPGEGTRSAAWKVVLALVLVLGLGAGFVGVILAGEDEAPQPPASPVAEDEETGALPGGFDESRIVTVLSPDAIPALTDPPFQSVSDVDWLTSEEPVIAVELNGDARAYPLQIMTWHEIVNNDVGGTPVTVTFCPLCNTAYAFQRPEVDGKVTTFGTSGKLYHSNLLMYDRATDSLWPQALGVATTGKLKGTVLERVPAQIVSWEEFRATFPEGRVVSRNTGHTRNYGENPYPGYDDIDSQPFLFEGEVDGRLAAVERVLGIEGRGAITAFPYFRLKEAADGDLVAINAEVGRTPVMVVWKEGTRSALNATSIAESKDVGAAFAFSRKLGQRVLSFDVVGGKIVDRRTGSTWNIFGRATSGSLEGEKLAPADAHDSFWFDWAAFHPNTQVWEG